MAKTSTKKPAPHKGASRNRKASSRKPVPGWLWLLLGLAFGIFAAFLWHLWDLRQDSRSATPVTTAVTTANAGTPGKKSTAIANTPASPANGAGEEPRFDFYTLLPNQQTMSNKQAASNKPAAEAVPVTTTPDSTSKTASAANAVQEPSYSLQAGSFKVEAEADKRRASILLLGLPVKILKIPAKPGETLYRVMVGPIKGHDAVQTARSNLRSNGIDTLGPKKI